MRLEQLGALAREVVTGNGLVVVTDGHVAELYLERCRKTLIEVGFQVDVFVIPPGEESKSGETYLELVNFLAQIPLTRWDAVVALGGGVVGDLAGFAAATYLRGINIIQVPTTLLAAVDSSIGGKTAINLPAGKNLAGAFHQPSLVLCDIETLKTLPEAIYRDGMAEVIKYGAIADGELFHLLEDKEQTQLHMKDIIEKCVSIKKRFVEEDMFDTGIRQLLNFGHTIGHGIEKITNYEVSHGSAVAKGMAMMADISVRQGWCEKDCANRMEKILKNYGFDLNVVGSKERLYDIIVHDKKRKGDTIDIVVPERIGTCRLQRISIDELGKIL